jgi:putative tricarboxylic transport membrane protein
VTTLMLIGLALLFSPLVFWLLGVSRRRRFGVPKSSQGGTPTV